VTEAFSSERRGAEFYGSDIAAAHHAAFSWAATSAAQALRAELAGAGLHAGTIVELGCGTGISCRILGDAGYHVIGVDLSADMLAIAREHAPAATFRQGSAFDAELPAGVVAVTAVGEILNYAAERQGAEQARLDQVVALARRAHEAIVPGGVLLFDLAVPGRAGPDGLQTRRRGREGLDVILDARESPDGSRLDRHITIYRDRGDGCWSRTVEEHVLHLLDADVVGEQLAELGFEVTRRRLYGPSELAEPPPGWVVFVARRP
jgi:SAM-dependent methyltransferase